jgi:hypothetical protein
MLQSPYYLDVVLPFEDHARFELSSFPVGQWLTLQDKKGEQIPVAVFVDRGTVLARWLST